MLEEYTFPAIFHTEADGISIYFPDLPGCLPCAKDWDEAEWNAKEALTLHLLGMTQDGEPIPCSTPRSKIPCQAGDRVKLVRVQMEGAWDAVK